MKRITRLSALLFASNLFAAGVEVETFEDKVGGILAAKRQRYGTPGMVVTIIRNGVIAGTFVSGYADRENQKPIEPDTLIPAASLTKLLTAVLVVRQAEQHRLQIDHPANEYLSPRMQIVGSDGKPSTATLAQLLSHHSGLPVSWKPIASEGDALQSLENYLSQNLKAAYPPGDRIIYANDAFSLAGFIAAKAERETFAEHATKVILKPLQMTTSTFASPWTMTSAKLSRAYGSLMAPGELAAHNDVTAALPAGGLVTTAPEFARFALMLLRGGALDGAQILSPAGVQELFTIQARPYADAQTGFGLGFGVRENQGRKIVWWDGGLAGVANRMILHPASQSGVVLLSNQSDNAASSEAANAIFDLLVPPAVSAPYKPTAEELKRFTGTYRFYDVIDPHFWFFRYFVDLHIEAEGGTLKYNSRLLRSGQLLPVGPGLFRFTGSRIAGLDAFFDGNTVYMLDLTARRIPVYQKAPVIGAAVLVGLIGLLYLFYRALHALLRGIFG